MRSAATTVHHIADDDEVAGEDKPRARRGRKPGGKNKPRAAKTQEPDDTDDKPTSHAVIAPPILYALAADDSDNVVAVDIDSVLAMLVLKLPARTWTREQRAAWQATFNAVADFLFPGSK